MIMCPDGSSLRSDRMPERAVSCGFKAPECSGILVAAGLEGPLGKSANRKSSGEQLGKVLAQAMQRNTEISGIR